MQAFRPWKVELAMHVYGGALAIRVVFELALAELVCRCMHISHLRRSSLNWRAHSIHAFSFRLSRASITVANSSGSPTAHFALHLLQTDM